MGKNAHCVDLSIRPWNPAMTRRKLITPLPGKAVIGLATLSDRLALPPRKPPYFFNLGDGAALGYKRREQGGVWVARLENPRLSTTLGTPVGEPLQKTLPILSYEEAIAAAKEWCARTREKACASATSQAPHAPSAPVRRTVGDALKTYGAILETRQVENVGAARSRLAKTNREIGHIFLDELIQKDLDDWLAKLVTTPPLVRSKKGEPPGFRKNWDPNDPKNKLARQSSANRALADVRAALEKARANKWIATDEAWRDVKPFTDCTGVRDEVLSLEQQSAALNRASPELRPLLYGALVTAQRFGPLSRVKVKDFRPEDRVLKVAWDKKHRRDRLAPLTTEAMVVFWAICRDRDPEEFIFVRASGGPWSKGSYNRPFKEACAGQKITFYGIRHTCITMWLLHGINENLVADAVATSVEMIKEHYRNPRGAWIAEKMDEKTHSISQATPEMEAILAEIAKVRDQRLAPAKQLEFSFASLHPSTYVGRVNGGRDEAPAPRLKPSREELARLMEEMPAGEIGKLYGVSGVTVAKWCRKEGLTPVPRGLWAKRRADARRDRPAEIAGSRAPAAKAQPTREELARLLEEMPATAIGDLYDVSGPAVLKWARKMGLQGPGRGAWAKRLAQTARQAKANRRKG